MSELPVATPVLDAKVFVSIRWRAGGIDRLMDEGHAAIVGWVVSTLTNLGWQVQPEVTYAIYGERGSIDVLATARRYAHPARRRGQDRADVDRGNAAQARDAKQARLAATVAAERFGWDMPAGVSRLIVLPESSTSRRKVTRHAPVLGQAYRLRGGAARAWLQNTHWRAIHLAFRAAYASGAW